MTLRSNAHRRSTIVGAAVLATVVLGFLGAALLRPWISMQLGIQLIDALDRYQIDRARRLLALGADVNAVDPQFGMTPLEEAVSGGSEALPLLLNRKDLRLHSPSAAGDGALIIALGLDEPPTVLQLLDAELRLGQVPSNLKASMARAVIRGDLVKIKRLLYEGLSPDARQVDWPSPLTLAATFDQPQAACLLLEHGANPNGAPLSWSGSTSFDARPLLMAVRRDNAEIVKALLDAGVRLDPSTENDYGPLTTAVGDRRGQSLSVLLNHPRSRSIARSDLKTALWMAETFGQDPRLTSALRSKLRVK